MLKKNPYHKGISLWLMHVSSMMLLWPSPGKTASGTIKGANYFTLLLGLAPQLGAPLRKEWETPLHLKYLSPPSHTCPSS